MSDFDKSNLLREGLKNCGWEIRLNDYLNCIANIYRSKDASKKNVSIVLYCENIAGSTFDNLKNQLVRLRSKHQIVAINNGNRTDRFDNLRESFDIYVELKDKINIYKAKNIGAALCNGSFILFLDDDMQIDENLIVSFSEAFEKYEAIAIRGNVKPLTQNPYNLKTNIYIQREKTIPYFCDIDFNVAFPSDIFFEIGGWDENINLNGGIELSLRLAKKYYDLRKQIYYPYATAHKDFAKNEIEFEKKKNDFFSSLSYIKKKHFEYDNFITNYAKISEALSPIEKKLKIKEFAKTPLISVCIPTRNRSSFLKEAIDSVLSQKYSNYEIIIVDDGSTDDTKKTVESYSLDKIKYFYKEHTNAPNTRNRCLKEASGDFILWLDDDDILEKNALLNYVDLINEYPEVDIFYGMLQSFGSSFHLYTYNEWHNNEEGLIGFLKNGSPIHNSMALIRKKVYEENGFFDESFLRAHDYNFWVKAALKRKYKFKYANKLVGFVRIHKSNLTGELKPTTDYSFENRILKFLIQNAFIEEIYPEKLWSLNYELAMNEALMDLSTRFLNRGDIENGLKFFIASFAYDSSSDKIDIARQFLQNSNLRILYPDLISSLQRVISKGEKCYQDIFKTKGKTTISSSALEYESFVNIGMTTFNRLEFTKQSIEALLKHTSYPYVLTVVDNGSVDGSREYLLDLKKKGVIKNLVLLSQNIGVAKASNIAWNLEPKAKYYLKLDNDIVIEKDNWLENLIEVVEKIPNAGAVAYNFEPVSYPLQIINGLSVRVKKEGNLGGACILIPRRTYEILGEWRDDYGLYGEEDADYGIRIALAGLLNIYMADEDVGKHLPSGKAAVIDPVTFEAKDGLEEKLYPEYRKFKDDLRRKNAEKGGAFQKNYQAYKNGILPLKYISEFAKNFLKFNNIEPDPRGVIFIEDADKKDFVKIDRPLRTLEFKAKGFVFIQNYSEACSYLRIRQIIDVLAANNSFEFSDLKTLLENKVESIDRNFVSNFDFVVFQRFVNEFVLSVFNLFQSTDKKIIYEIDDNLLELPKENVNYPVFKAIEKNLITVLGKSDLVTVTTSVLRKKFERYAKQIAVLPNLLDTRIWNFNYVKKANKKVKILFSGTPTHQSDFKVIIPALRRILIEFKDRIEFYYVGIMQVPELNLPNVIKAFDFTPDYQSYASKLQSLNADIGLIPLEINDFNRCKSNIKWLEYSACKIASIMTDIEAYSYHIINREDGLLVPNDEEKWYQAIKELIENENLRKKIAENAFVRVAKEFTVESKWHYWKLCYDLILEKNVCQVSIIIPIYNKLEFTKRCLKGIIENTKSIDYEIIIVDNASSDGSKEYLTELSKEKPRIRYVRNETNLGFSKANNIGVKYSRGKYLMFLNNDTYPLENWLSSSLNLIEKDPSVAAVGSKLLFPDDTIQHAGVVIVEDKKINDPLVARHYYYKISKDDPAVNKPFEYQALTAACLLVNKFAFLEVLGFDEGYWNGYEDVDLCFKLRRAGYRLVYNPESVVYHYESQSGPERFSKVKHNIERLHKKWLGRVKTDFIVLPDLKIIEGDAKAIREYIPYEVTRSESKLREESAQSINEEISVIESAFVSIIILTYNQLKYTKECFESLYKYTRIKFELIVVDNASKDGTVEFLKKFASEKNNVKLILNDVNLGFPTAVNQGLKEASGNYVVIANNDIVFTEEWLERLLIAINKKPEYMIAGPISNVVSGFQIDKNARYSNIKEMEKYAAKVRAENKGKYFEFPRVAFLCALIKRELIDKLGGLDERFTPGNFEDDDFCLRAQLAGYKTIIVQDSFIHHYGSKSFTAEGVQKYAERLKKNREIFVEKWNADPDELWLKGKPIRIRKTYYPLNKDFLQEKIERIKTHLEDNEISLAKREINLAFDYIKENKRNEDSQKVEELYQLSLKIDSLKDEKISSFANLISEAYEKYVDRNFEEAVKLFEKAKILYEEFQNDIISFEKKEIYILGGAIHLASGNYAKAIEYFEVVKQSDKNEIKAYEGLAECYIALGEFKKALEELSLAEKINPEETSLKQKINQIKMKMENKNANE